MKYFCLVLLLVGSLVGAQERDREATRRLYSAIRYADADGIAQAIHDGADLDANWSTSEIHSDSKDSGLLSVTHADRYSKYTPAEYACKFFGQAKLSYDLQGAHETVRTLLKAGAKPQPVLRYAAYYGDHELVKQIFDNAKQHPDMKDCEMMHNAVESKRKEIVQLLLKKGADAKCQYFDSPVLVYASTPEIVQLLIDGGADLKAKADKGVSEIFEAALRESRLFPFVPFQEQNNPSYYNESRDRALALMLKKGAPIRYEWQIRGLLSDAKDLNYKETTSALEERLKKVEVGQEGHGSPPARTRTSTSH